MHVLLQVRSEIVFSDSVQDFAPARLVCHMCRWGDNNKRLWVRSQPLLQTHHVAAEHAGPPRNKRGGESGISTRLRMPPLCWRNPSQKMPETAPFLAVIDPLHYK